MAVLEHVGIAKCPEMWVIVKAYLLSLFVGLAVQFGWSKCVGPCGLFSGLPPPTNQSYGKL